MKIFLCDNRLGGLLSFRSDVICHLRNSGHEVTLLCPKTRSEWDRIGQHIEGVKIQQIPLDPNGTNPLQDLKLLCFLIRLYRRERPDLVFNYTIKPNVYSAIAARMMGIPCVDMVTGLGYTFQDNSLKHKLARALYRLGVKQATWVMTLNEQNKETLIRGGYAQPDRIIHLPGGEGVNLKSYPYKEKHYDGVPRFLVVSRVLRDKGYAEFVEAARTIRELHPEVRFQWLGPIDDESPMRVERETLEKDVASGAIEYLGVSNNVQDYLSADDIVIVLPSYHEGMSRSLMEALAMGCPIIASNIAGCKELVQDGKNGLLVCAKDTKSLAQAMQQFVAMSAAEKADMSRASYQLAKERFDIEHVLKIYDQILAK